jgi:hypothetical protein
MPIIAIALVVAAALGGGTAAVAEHSLPGEPLWNFKIHVNEGVRSAMAVSDEAQAKWDIAVLETRLNEAKELAADDKLTATAQADISANFDAHADEVAVKN